MPLTEEVISYELLFRINADWTVRGAHLIEETGTFKDGTLKFSQPGDAQPILVGVTKAGLDLSTILGNLAAGLALERDAQAATIAAHEATIKEQAALLAERAPVQAELDAANANIQALMARIEAMDSAQELPAIAADGGEPTEP